LSEDEKRVLRPWNERFARFVQGKDVPWAAGGEREMLRLNANGETEVWTDEDWEEGVELWRVVNGGVSPGLLSWMKSRL
jgi:hypothetical protein